MSVRFIVLALIMLACLGWGDCDLQVNAASGEPLGYAPVLFYNSFGDLNGSYLSNSSGGVAIIGECDNGSLSVSYAVSNYSAALSNFSISSPVYLNGLFTARVMIKNTLGAYLEAQDCAVSVYKNASSLLKDYKTACQVGEPFLDRGGNWASVSNCVLSNSQGWYYFSGSALESEGYRFGENYTLSMVCNGQEVSGSFYVANDEGPDVERIEDFVLNYAGFIVLGCAAGLLLLGLAVIILLVLRRRRGSGPGPA